MWKKFDIYMNGHRHRNHSKVQIIFLVIVLCCVPACLYTHFFPRLTAPHCLAQVVPRTTRIVEQIFEATSMTSGNIKFSKLDPGTHMCARHLPSTSVYTSCHPLPSTPPAIHFRLHLARTSKFHMQLLTRRCSPPHCGPSNQRIRMHLGAVITRCPCTCVFFTHSANPGLEVPEGAVLSIAGGSMVALVISRLTLLTPSLTGEQRQWKQGEVIVFDDSFEHEVWHNGSRCGVTAMRCVYCVLHLEH
jgi:hypothetical protein